MAAYTGDYTPEKGRDKEFRTSVKAKDKADDAMSSIADKGREVADDVSAVAGNLKGAVDSSIKEQPMATLAVAVGIGFVLGALWKT